MFSEIALQAEVDYRQQRYLDEAHWYRLGQLARANAPARKSWLASVLSGLTGRTPRQVRRARTREIRSQRNPSRDAAAADRSAPCTV